MSASIWIGDGDRTRPHPRLKGRLGADVVVVGGGITGLMVAWCLCRAGKHVVLLEAIRIGAGNTGHSTGNLYATVSSGLVSLRRKWSAAQVRAAVQLRSQAMEELLDKRGKPDGARTSSTAYRWYGPRGRTNTSVRLPWATKRTLAAKQGWRSSPACFPARWRCATPSRCPARHSAILMRWRECWPQR